MAFFGNPSHAVPVHNAKHSQIAKSLDPQSLGVDKPLYYGLMDYLLWTSHGPKFL